MKQVSSLKKGDQFIWIDRPVTILNIEVSSKRSRGRSSRWITVSDPVGPAPTHRLSYYDDEWVETP